MDRIEQRDFVRGVHLCRYDESTYTKGKSLKSVSDWTGSVLLLTAEYHIPTRRRWLAGASGQIRSAVGADRAYTAG